MNTATNEIEIDRIVKPISPNPRSHKRRMPAMCSAGAEDRV